MHFSIPTLSALLLLAGGAAATDATFYQYDGCSGALYTRYGLPSNTCVILAQVASSIGFNGIPGGAKGQAYTSQSCSSYRGETTGSGCISGGGSAVHAANWFYSSKRRSTPLERRQAPERYGVYYTMPDGLKVREVEVSAEHLKRTLKLVEDKDYEALAALPDVSYTC